VFRRSPRGHRALKVALSTFSPPVSPGALQLVSPARVHDLLIVVLLALSSAFTAVALHVRGVHHVTHFTSLLTSLYRSIAYPPSLFLRFSFVTRSHTVLTGRLGATGPSSLHFRHLNPSIAPASFFRLTNRSSPIVHRNICHTSRSSPSFRSTSFIHLLLSFVLLPLCAISSPHPSPFVLSNISIRVMLQIYSSSSPKYCALQHTIRFTYHVLCQFAHSDIALVFYCRFVLHCIILSPRNRRALSSARAIYRFTPKLNGNGKETFKNRLNSIFWAQ
jgi:hypothetical protein